MGKLFFQEERKREKEWSTWIYTNNERPEKNKTDRKQKTNKQLIAVDLMLRSFKLYVDGTQESIALLPTKEPTDLRTGMSFFNQRKNPVSIG